MHRQIEVSHDPLRLIFVLFLTSDPLRLRIHLTNSKYTVFTVIYRNLELFAILHGQVFIHLWVIGTVTLTDLLFFFLSFFWHFLGGKQKVDQRLMF